MRRAAQLLKGLASAKHRMENEPRGKAKNRRAEAARLAQETGRRAGNPPAATIAIIEPTSYKMAMAGAEYSEWTLATKQEIGSRVKNGTWELVNRQPWMEVIGSSWKLKLKRDQSGAIMKYKARLVARGNMQEMD